MLYFDVVEVGAFSLLRCCASEGDEIFSEISYHVLCQGALGSLRLRAAQGP